MKIGILKEGKVPFDRRTPITPQQARAIKTNYPEVELVCKRSGIRYFDAADYTAQNIDLVDDVSDCDVLFGVKEVPISELIADKTYFFFSHTYKKQAYNRELLREILKKNIRLIDYEILTNENGERIIGFGRYAGIVGAYNSIWIYGKRYNLFDIRRVHECFDLEDMTSEYCKVKLPKIKIVITGGGRVSKGAMEIMAKMNIRKVTPARFVSESFNEPVYTQICSEDYNKHKAGKEFNKVDFFNNPKDFKSNFLQYATCADIFIACAFWDLKAPVLFTREEIIQKNFKIKIIGDVTCDIEGSIPSTKKLSTIDAPIYDYDPMQDKVVPALSNERNITVMAIENLPSELPKNASEDFGRKLVDNVLPNLIGEDKDGIIKRATITENGKLTSNYAYLQDYVDGK